MRSAGFLMAVLLCLGTGCAHYEYNLVRPPELTRHIGTETDEVFTVDPLQYRLRTVDNRLVVRIYNTTDDPVELLGTRSTVVDPDGQSHPLRGQTIAAGSFIKLIFPPIPPRIYDYGPTFGIGVGYGYHTAVYPYHARPGYHFHPAYGPPYGPYWHDPALYGPRYLAVVEGGDTTYWDWKGADGEMRLLLAFQRQGKEFRQEFVFRRQKM
jgi:hypothetical protein